MLCRQRIITGTEISGLKYPGVTLQLVSTAGWIVRRERDIVREERERDSPRGESDRQFERRSTTVKSVSVIRETWSERER